MNGRVVRRSALVVLVAAIAGGLLATSGAGQSSEQGLIANRFSLTADGYEATVFTDLKEVTKQVDVTEYLASPDKDAALSKVGATLRPVLTFKRPARGRSLWEWHAAMLRGDPAGRRNVTLTAFSPDGKVVAKFYLEGAFPSKLTIGGLAAGGSEALIETVTLVATDIQRLSPQ